jgi:anti-anti-sigma factor
MIDVRLVGLPVELHARTDRHLSSLQRELELILLQDPDEASVPARLHELFEELRNQFGGFGERQQAILDAAIGDGIETIDLSYQMPPSVGLAARRLDALLDEVDAYCQQRTYLLTGSTPPDALAYRRWFLGEFQRQAEGAPPSPWSAHELEREVLPPGWSTDGGAAERPVTVTVTGSLDLETAPQLRELLVAALGRGQEVLVDLRECTFVDSVGLSVVVAAMVRAEAESIAIRFRLGPVAERLLELSDLLDRIVIEE